MDFPINYQIHDLSPRGFNLKGIYEALVENLTGAIDEGLLPAAGPPGYTSYAPKFDGLGWSYWDQDLRDYKPLSVTVDGVNLAANPSANRLQATQNKSGTIALLDDVYGIRDTVVVPEGLVSVDWDIGSTFKCVLSQDRKTAFYMTHSRPGMKKDMLVINNGTAQDVVWDSSILWPGGTAPGIPPAAPGAASSILVTLRNIGGTIYAESQTQPQWVT